MASLFIVIPFLLLIVLNMPFKFLRQGIAFWVTAGFLILQSLLALSYPFFSWSSYPGLLGQFFSFELSPDSLSLIVLFTIGVVAFISLLVAQATIFHEQRRDNFINLLLLSLVGMNTTVLVRDIFSLYVFVEITAVAVLVLIALGKNRFAIEGVFKYLVLSIIASVFMLSSIAFIILTAGDTSFEAIHRAFLNGANKTFLNFAAGLFLCGALIKSGAMPFHGWVPDTYSEAPAPVSVLLAGIITKVTGVYVLLRLFASVFILNAAMQNVLLFIGAGTIVFAALAALTQGDVKRMLSYSSISQVGYIVLALGCATPLAFAGAVFHFFNHAIFKSLLFVNAAALEKKTGSTDMAIIAGLGSKLPVTSTTSLFGMLSAAGIPPLAGFWSKLIIILALWSSGRFGYASIALLASILTLAYFLSLQRLVFFVKSETALEDTGTVPFGIHFSEILLAAFTIVVGLFFPFIFSIWLSPLKGIIH